MAGLPSLKPGQGHVHINADGTPHLRWLAPDASPDDNPETAPHSGGLLDSLLGGGIKMGGLGLLGDLISQSPAGQILSASPIGSLIGKMFSRGSGSKSSDSGKPSSK